MLEPVHKPRKKKPAPAVHKWGPGWLSLVLWGACFLGYDVHDALSTVGVPAFAAKCCSHPSPKDPPTTDARAATLTYEPPLALADDNGSLVFIP